MSNRQRIIDAALMLFNDQGTGAVSTNHIADAAGISPGNLYYHFRNKEEIIRVLFERLFAAWARSAIYHRRTRKLKPREKISTLL